MKPAKLSPSMMCADICYTQETLQMFSAGGIEYLHVDIMDGHFVPNFTLGADYCRQLQQNTQIPLDIHMMVEQPEDKIHWFSPPFGSIISVHVEACVHLQRTLQNIREKGCRAFAALNPATSYEPLRWVLDDLDGILIMTVNPEFAGQKMVAQTLEKIRHCRRWLDDLGYSNVDLEVDGNVSVVNAEKMRAAGANIFVGGTSALFQNGRVSKEGLCLLRQAVSSGPETLPEAFAK